MGMGDGGIRMLVTSRLGGGGGEGREMGDVVLKDFGGLGVELFYLIRAGHS